MQLWQKKSSNIEINGLWDKTLTGVKRMLEPETLRSRRFLPRQYLAALTEEMGHLTFSPEQLGGAAEKIFWNDLTGGHPELQLLFKEYGYKKGAEKAALFNYEVSHLIGSGRSGAVYSINEQYVLKAVPARDREKLQREFTLLSRMESAYIVKAFDFCESRYGAGMVLERLNPPSVDGQGYLSALEFLHGKGVCHGDIRFTNLGSSRNGKGKLFDLGNAFYGHLPAMEKEKTNLRLLLEKFNCI